MKLRTNSFKFFFYPIFQMLFLLMASNAPVFAAPADLDLSFNGTGLVSTRVGNTGVGAMAVALTAWKQLHPEVNGISNYGRVKNVLGPRVSKLKLAVARPGHLPILVDEFDDITVDEALQKAQLWSGTASQLVIVGSDLAGNVVLLGVSPEFDGDVAALFNQPEERAFFLDARLRGEMPPSGAAPEVVLKLFSNISGTPVYEGDVLLGGAGSTCGNGEIELGEVCDDGNVVYGDGCDGVCRSNETCGNRVTDVGEVCDDGNEAVGDGCEPDCGSDGRCGNNVHDANEVCDDGNIVSGDGCRGDCQSLEGPTQTPAPTPTPPSASSPTPVATPGPTPIPVVVARRIDAANPATFEARLYSDGEESWLLVGRRGGDDVSPTVSLQSSRDTGRTWSVTEVAAGCTGCVYGNDEGDLG